MFALGLTTNEVAILLKRSEKTVGKHRERLMKKLSIHDGVRLAHLALAAGLVQNIYATPSKPDDTGKLANNLKD